MFQPSRILLFVALIPGVLVATVPSKFWEMGHAAKAASAQEPSSAFIVALR